MHRKLERKDAGEMTRGVLVPEIKSKADSVIEGYGAVFNRVDGGFDVIQPGAFAASLAENSDIKMLWQHAPSEVIGVWDKVVEDDHGLRVKGRLLGEVEKGREAQALVKAGALGGLSIGYSTVVSRRDTIDGQSVRVIESAKLWEVSLVTFPMNSAATIDAKAASQMSKRELERALLRDSKFSRQVVTALMADGFKGVQALSESGGDDYSELLEAVVASDLLSIMQ